MSDERLSHDLGSDAEIDSMREKIESEARYKKWLTWMDVLDEIEACGSLNDEGLRSLERIRLQLLRFV